MQNVTLQENILFGKLLNNQIYRRVIEACALRADIAILPGGDQVISFIRLNPGVNPTKLFSS
jgi:hypothetical protein